MSFVILLAILLTIISPVASAVFSMTLFEEVLSASVADFLASIYQNSKLKVFKNINFLGEISNN